MREGNEQGTGEKGRQVQSREASWAQESWKVALTHQVAVLGPTVARASFTCLPQLQRLRIKPEDWKQCGADGGGRQIPQQIQAYRKTQKPVVTEGEVKRQMAEEMVIW